MNRIATLASVLSLAFVASCAKETPASRNGSLDSPTDRATPPGSDDESTPDEVADRFSHTSYPTQAISETGTLGKARAGTLIAAADEKSTDLSAAWENGPAIVIFYRGHW